MKRSQRLLFFLLIILLPSQLGYHFWPEFSLVSGIRVDYLAPTVYLTDLLLLSILSLENFVFSKRPNWHLTSKMVVGLFFFLFIILNSYFSVSPLLAIYKWFKIIEFLIFAFWIRLHKKDVVSIVVGALPLALLWTSLLAVSQWLNNGSVNGLFYYLGERSFTVNTPGIALSKIGTIVALRPYATLPHPNALAGFIAVSMLLLKSLVKFLSKFQIPIFVLGVFVLILCQSYTTYLALLFLCLVPFSQPMIVGAYSFSILTPVLFSKINLSLLPKNILERAQLSVVAGKMITDAPLFGVGLGGYIRLIPKYLYGKVLLLQPVHNIPLLVFSETGIIGSICLLSLLLLVPLTPAFIIIFITSLFDHYWLTLQSPSLLLAIVVGLSYNPLSGKDM